MGAFQPLFCPFVRDLFKILSFIFMTSGSTRRRLWCRLLQCRIFGQFYRVWFSDGSSSFRQINGSTWNQPYNCASDNTTVCQCFNNTCSHSNQLWMVSNLRIPVRFSWGMCCDLIAVNCTRLGWRRQVSSRSWFLILLSLIPHERWSFDCGLDIRHI